MNPDQVKEKYLRFFESKDHVRIPSASVVPENDPTVLFNTAGMQPLVPFLMGTPHPSGKRLTNVQKCIRTGDIDEVGDATHLTFFEMLGNWSLGDYFKQEAILWSWEFLTGNEWLNLDKNRLAVTVFAGDDNSPKDEEAATIWKSLGMSSKRIAYLGAKDNWWGPAGQTGPCGPDTEMFYWKPNHLPPPIEFDPEDDHWVEIWNDVFMQYEKVADGSLQPLKQKNVDTGMGFERCVMTLQGADSVYDTPLFTPILDEIATLTGLPSTKSCRIIADHLRTATIILGDERTVVPSNVDQGYVLRRLIRRAVRHGLLLNISDSFCCKIAKVVIDTYKHSYPVLDERKDHIFNELQKEEQKFRQTLEKGMQLIKKQVKNNIIGTLAVSNKELFVKYKSMHEDAVLASRSEIGITQIQIKSKWLFDMFQSQGMPPELVLEEIKSMDFLISDESGLLAEFQKLFLEHQEKSRVGAEKKFKGGLADNSERTTRLHTATHILNEALRKVVDPNITQKGSNITAERLRFDFNFDRKLTPEEINAVEDEVNRVIEEGYLVDVYNTTPEEAKQQGAQSEFAVKYPSLVSVYRIGEYSLEICMGPHVENTKNIGKFTILKEESSAAGVRRIKATVD